MLHFIVNWLAGTPSFATPYALAALGLIVSERAGVLSLGAEGFMLVGALAGVATELELGGYPGVALLVAMLAAARGLAAVCVSGRFPAGQSGDRRPCGGVLLSRADQPRRHARRLGQSCDHRPARSRDLAAVGNPDRRQDPVHPGRRRLSHHPDLLSGQLRPDPHRCWDCGCARSAKIRRPPTPRASAYRSIGSARWSPGRR